MKNSRPLPLGSSGAQSIEGGDPPPRFRVVVTKASKQASKFEPPWRLRSRAPRGADRRSLCPRLCPRRRVAVCMLHASTGPHPHHRGPICNSGHARPTPLVCVRSPPYLLLVTGVRLAPPGSFLVEATFAPAQPPFMVTELLGEKTNLKQKQS
jgi:hypothetical protein